MNSTLKSLLFWMVLVIIGVLIWNFSTKFQQHDRQITFSEFMSWADAGSVEYRSVLYRRNDLALDTDRERRDLRLDGPERL